MLRSILIWIFTFLFTAGIAVYQRLTGPTHPVNESMEIAGKTVEADLLRSHGGPNDAEITVPVPDESFNGRIRYKRHITDDSLRTVKMNYNDGKLTGRLPHQPPAGKLEYDVYISKNGQTEQLNQQKVLIRFKGAVPDYILIPHIILMFTAMLFSTRSGIEALVKGKQTYLYTKITLITLFLGGLILGPMMQFHAFNDAWTGWPLGEDLTDNKTLVAFIFWLVAFFRIKKSQRNRGWVIAASIVLLAIYLIPHSMFGSEYNYEAGEVQTGKN